MFTGIIEELGKVESIREGNEALELTVQASTVLEDVSLGDSIAVNGVCLTVTHFSSHEARFDVMPETYKATSLRELKKGSEVNLERSMAAGGRFGGHMVTGHVDGVGTIVQKERESNAVYYDIRLPDELMSYFVYKGSVAVDGTSLTVFGVKSNTITISLIPHTMEHTVLGHKGVGDTVNIETDLIGKYVVNLLSNSSHGKESNVTEQFLKDNGFY
ncbi:riboflavin synthase subunit alpha [Pontibacillus halophilus JSM 076056 = DSM 19796]|uniref:Riboflavin synthase n=1 Tax=Pontibacillus halophilus JSM 076056 = DSM 19796 TaxID=1385510 RepID=A0A0A5GRC9_9BACI|nr:riboflavin synthase [Pontibacillus halophilus]KGX93813.1 riboflavin synthase subunit alpha [Pontibacillus halophilus JSM 076056 = DSM 19796]